jgi:hypothetical protein
MPQRRRWADLCYAAVMFYTSGELPMSDARKAALLNFVRAGRRFLGVRSATDTLRLSTLGR